MFPIFNFYPNKFSKLQPKTNAQKYLELSKYEIAMQVNINQ